MLSRRAFLAASFGLIIQPAEALAGRKGKAAVTKLGPRTLAREQWPPSISPEFISVVDKGYALLSDQSGRLAIVDFKRDSGPQVIGELSGLGKKTADLAVAQGRAYALATQEVGGEIEHDLVSVSILPSTDPTLLSRIALPMLSEAVTIAASTDAVVVGGTGPRGENQVLIFAINSRRRPDENTSPVAVLSFEQPVTRVELVNKQLLVLQGGAVSILDVYNLTNPRSPVKFGSLRLEGHYEHMARTPEAIVLGGQNAKGQQELLMVSVRTPLQVVSRISILGAEILDVAAQRGQLLALVNRGSRLAVLPVTYQSKSLVMTAGEAVLLPIGQRGGGSRARIAVRDREAYVISDGGGVQVLSINKNGWQFLYSHNIPRLPVAAVALAGSKAVLAGSELKIYDIAQPAQPALLATAEPGGVVRALASTGNLLLALSRDLLSLRLFDQPGQIVSSLKIEAGQTLAFDAQRSRAYVLSADGKTTSITSVAVSKKLTSEKAQTVQDAYRHGCAANGKLLLGGLNSLALHDMDNGGGQIASRSFPNLALRALALRGDTAILTALDSNSRGYLLLINIGKPDLPTIGSIDLPQDALALAVSGTTAVVVGRGDGKDVASLVDLSNPIAPKVTTSFPVVEAASAVAIENQLAVIAGRGLEIISLT